MRIGKVAWRSGVNVETLRYYERRGLLAKPPRGPNGHRRYDEQTVRFVRAVKEAQSLGFTLSEIQEHLDLTRRPRGSGHGVMRVRLAAKIDQVHVTNGESVGNSLRSTGLGGAVLSWQDVLYEGPVPAVPAEELERIRARFLSECGWGSERALLDSLARRDRFLQQALSAGSRVVLGVALARAATGHAGDSGARAARVACLPRAAADEARASRRQRYVRTPVSRRCPPPVARGAPALRQRALADGAAARRGARRGAAYAA